MPRYNVTYPDGSTNSIIAKEDHVKSVTADGGSYELIPPRVPTKVEIERFERVWRDKQLEQTDKYVSVTDHPQHNAIMAYRVKLRDWPSTDDFPDTKPTIEG